MAIIDINLNPSKRDLRWFGLILFLFFLLMGGVVYWKSGTTYIANALWAIGAVLSAAYYLLRPLRRPIYLGFMYLVYPIGWTLSHVMFSFIYYIVLTPIGLIMRAFGYDAIQRRIDHKATTYWVKRDANIESSRYFRQF